MLSLTDVLITYLTYDVPYWIIDCLVMTTVRSWKMQQHKNYIYTVFWNRTCMFKATVRNMCHIKYHRGRSVSPRHPIHRSGKLLWNQGGKGSAKCFLFGLRFQVSNRTELGSVYDKTYTVTYFMATAITVLLPWKQKRAKYFNNNFLG